MKYGKRLTAKEANELINTPDSEIFDLLAAANKIKNHYKGNKVKLCAIVNAKSGQCSENCSFCAQSSHHKTQVETYPLMSSDEIFKTAKNSQDSMQATCFSIVTSGKSMQTKEEIATVGKALKDINDKTDLNRCVSMGTLSKTEIEELKKNGLKRLHHNLETAESFFPKMCTTHKYQERLDTLRAAKDAGLEVCSGGIFGIGETPEQRVELGLTLRDLEVESVPINILNPVTGTPAAENYKPMTPLEVLKLIATYRFLMPKADIGIFGGREMALGQLQPLMFIAGANVTLIGNYLTTQGQAAEKDLQMIKDLGLEIDRSHV